MTTIRDFSVLNQYTTTTPTYTNPPPPTEECVEVKLTRELDGVHDTGVIGELLTLGTNNLAETNRLFSLQKFKTSGLLAEDNQAVSSNAALTGAGAICEDDMYVAGDPGVGGKGNNYQFKEISVQPGFYTMLEDGAANGRKMLLNSHVDIINEQGNTAFTEYGMVITDDQGLKTQATVSGGQLTIIDANGQQRKLQPGEVYIVGNPADPAGKFYYKDVPGAGENGAPEKRVIFESYEKPTQAVVDQLVAQGADRADIENRRTVTTASFGFRVPDGDGTYRMSEGVGAGTPLKTTKNGVKTYYDAHFSEGECSVLELCKPVNYPPPPPPPPVYPPPPVDPPTNYPPPPPPPVDPPPPVYPPPPPPPPVYPPPPVAEDEHARIWGDPHIVEADQGKYDFNEAGIFNVLKDSNVAVNARLETGPGNTTVIKEAGMTVGARTIRVTPDGSAVIGFLDPNIKAAAITLEDGQTVMLGDGNSVTKNADKITVNTTEYKVQFDTKEAWKGFDYLNIDVWSKSGGVLQDGVAPSGLLGETFDVDDIQQTAIKLNSNNYKESNLFSPVFLPNTPVPQPSPTPPVLDNDTDPVTPPPVVDTPPIPPPVVDTPPIPPPVNNTPPANGNPFLQMQKMLEEFMAMFMAFFQQLFGGGPR